MVSYTIAHEAYLKIMFHAAKHPHLPVNGVLLGKLSSSEMVVIEDAIPLLHHWTSLSPMMEISLDLSRTYAESVGMALVGYYQACERLEDTSLAPVGEKVAEKLREQFKDAIAFVIDGRDLGENLRSGKASLIPYLPLQLSSSWRPYSPPPVAFTPPSPFILASQDSPSRTAALLEEKRGEPDAILQKFGDFDDHLEDVSIDWLRNRACMAVVS
ncbi:hypothetical protein PILCRDRAFT_61464 [Piloderma croceum F 1598]|uniref:MPN domain-containing protein n=1 Tax=Piloderma croceum (strain F 1598) TaxID=765440 RepID=A0A0C3GBD6_PILCF|nr:hypothetical protein PILCRDRAFT_61464 [Piloderma croceum F 1598]